MRDDRAQILGQIRVSLQTALLPSARATVAPHLFEQAGDRATMIANFRRELEPLGGQSYVVQDEAAAIELVLDLLKQAGIQDLMMWDETEIPVRGLGDALRSHGYVRHDVDVPQDPEGRKQKLMELERAGVGITGARAGLADTGSLALVSSAGSSRLASLLPPVHIALVPTSRLFPNMASFFAAHPDVTQQGSNLVFVAGPSRTADIEMTLQRGVHGPKFLHVVLIENA